MERRRALVTGVTGQDGAYVARLLLSRGYEVYGAIRRNSSANDWRLQELGINNAVKLIGLEMLELSNIMNTLRDVKPYVIFNLAAQSFVAESFASRSIRRMWMPWGRCVSSKPSARQIRKFVIIRRRPLKCSERRLRDRRTKERHFIRAAPMAFRSYLGIGRL